MRTKPTTPPNPLAADTIRRRLYAIEQRRAKLEAKFKGDREALDKEVLELRARCSHEQHTYHPDPSGNNDSFYSCDACRMEW